MKRFARTTALLVAGTTALLCSATPSTAFAGPVWSIDSLADSTVVPGKTLDYIVETRNAGDAATSGQISVAATLPPAMTAVSARLLDEAAGTINACFDASDGKSPVNGTSSIVCPTNDVVPANSSLSLQKLVLTVRADTSASGILKATFTVSGGGAASAASTVDPTLASATAPGFGVDAFDGYVGDVAGHPLSQAGGHPAVDSVSIDFNTITNPSPFLGSAWPVEPVKDVLTDLPAGLIGDPTVMDRCTVPQLANANGGSFDPRPLCAATSQVGTVTVRIKGSLLGLGGPNSVGPLPVFNLVPPPGAAAAFGFNVLGSVVILVGTVRTGGDYGVSVNAVNLPEALAIVGTKFNFWGVPADPSHDAERACPGEILPYLFGPTCGSNGAPLRAFLRLPTSCIAAGDGVATTARVDSWEHPGSFQPPVTWFSHEPPGYPSPSGDWGPQVGIEGCAEIPFEPSLSLTPTTEAADSPTGLDIRLHMPQHGLNDEEGVAESDLRKAVVTLPPGISINPSAATGQKACSSSQIGMTTAIGASPIHFDEASSTCPDASKIGVATLTSPLLGIYDDEGKAALDGEGNTVPRQLEGSVYLAAQSDNPFGSLLAMYLVVEDEQSGITLKLPGQITADPQTGQLETTFDENPQLPFEELRLHLFGGSRAALRTPPTCGTYSTQATLSGWSGKTVSQESSFQITQGCGGGFNPGFSAGTINPLAGQTSPFILRLTREDGMPEFTGLTDVLPPGLSGYLSGIPYCPDATLAAISTEPGTGAAQIASPSCPPASELGTVTVGAGAGPNPVYVDTGRAYLAGPYKGAPLSVAAVVPAVAGPFDLGNSVVRTALRLDPDSAQITAVSDPFPTILQGIPVDLRDVRFDLDRDHFTLNPTSCDPTSTDATITGTSGASAQRSVHFQVTGCDKLGFKPKLALKLEGKTKRGENPALTAVLRARPGDANIDSVQVALPHSEFLAQSHIKTICTRVQFAADACPAGSVYGKVTATTPLLDYPLTGNVYLRSSSHNLPDLVLSLHGPASQPIEIDAVGRIDSVKGGIRTSFKALPDAPLNKVVLSLPGGRKGLLENSRNICASASKATVQMDAQSGKVADLRPALKAKCPKRKPHRHRHKR